jgi:hypothetical protein
VQGKTITTQLFFSFDSSLMFLQSDSLTQSIIRYRSILCCRGQQHFFCTLIAVRVSSTIFLVPRAFSIHIQTDTLSADWKGKQTKISFHIVLIMSKSELWWLKLGSGRMSSFRLFMSFLHLNKKRKYTSDLNKQNERVLKCKRHLRGVKSQSYVTVVGWLLKKCNWGTYED